MGGGPEGRERVSHCQGERSCVYREWLGDSVLKEEVDRRRGEEGNFRERKHRAVLSRDLTKNGNEDYSYFLCHI